MTTEPTFEEKYPEHVKLDKIKDDSQTIGLFLEWMWGRYTPCDFDEESGRHYPTSKDIIAILGEYYNIDNKVLQEEKHQMLIELRRKD